MTVVKIPIDGPSLRNTDEVANKDNAVRVYDGFIDELGALNKRPGSEEFLDTGLGANKICNGLRWWEHKQCAIAVIDGNVYKVTFPSGLPTLTNLTSATLSPSNPATFATDGTYVFIANGGKIVYTDGSALTAYHPDTDAPLNCTHVAYLDGYLLANRAESNQWVWSDVNSTLTMSALNFASGAGNADFNDALHVAWREIYLFGKNSVEIWENDGSTPFSRAPGGFIEVGCGAKYSVVQAAEAFWWLSRDRRLMRMSHDKSPEVMSTPYDKELQGFSSISDARSSVFNIAGRNFLLMDFAVDNRTLVMEYSDGRFYEWGKWDSVNYEYDRLPGVSFAYCPEWGFHLSGNNYDANILKWSTSLYSDSGSLIRPAIRTGWMDHGSSKMKRSNRIHLRLKRGAVTTSPVASAVLHWRSDGKNEWSSDVSVSLGSVGESEQYRRIFRTGMFRSRQFELYVTDNVPVTVVDFDHDVDYLNR